jgi:hypothetical protein
MPKLDFSALFTRRNRGILLDVIVFLISLILMRTVTRLSLDFVAQSETDWSAKLAIGSFFAGLLFLQPLGPLLKRWSFHQRDKSFDLSKTETAGCLLLWFMPVYLVMMMMVSAAAAILISEAFFERGSPGAQMSGVGLLAGFVVSIVNTVIVYRYFVIPKKKPRWRFLMTPQAEVFGDVCMFLNMILLQILWNCLTASAFFWELLTSTPLGKAGSVTDIIGRFIIIGALALLVYIPPRIFYLVHDRQRKITWLTMALANLPLIIRAVFASHR